MKKRYNNYLESIKGQRDSEKSTAEKVAHINYMLSTLMARRKKLIRKNKYDILISFLIKEGKVIFLSFSFKENGDHPDSVLHMGEEEIESNYLEEQKEYDNPSPLPQEYLAKVGFVHSFHNVHGDLFYGVGEKKETRSNEERIDALSQLDNNDLGSYEKLFNLRRDLAYIEKVYVNDQYPSVIMKYFGLIKDNEVVFVQYTYPHFYYLEEKF